MDLNSIRNLQEAYQEVYEGGQFSAYGQVRYGSTPGTATDKSVSDAVDKALANPGTSQSASSTTGKTGLTGSGSISYSGTVGSGNRPTPTSTAQVAKPAAPMGVRKPTDVRTSGNRSQVDVTRSSDKIDNSEKIVRTERGGDGTNKFTRTDIFKRSLPEEYDLFDYLLEYLVAEGYADTNQAAIVMMANMSEEWRQSIMEREFDEPGESGPDVERHNAELRRRSGKQETTEQRMRRKAAEQRARGAHKRPRPGTYG